MLSLIEYDRQHGELVGLTRFDDDRSAHAASVRRARELELARSGVLLEVVLLEAASEADLQRTHRRYFETVTELTKSE